MIETLYRRKSPETAWHEEYFELTMGEQTVDDQLGYFVRETQCWWDAAGKRTVRVQYTLSPRGGFATLEEANERYELQRAARARRGFVHSFAPRYNAAGRCKYERIEISAPESTNMNEPNPSRVRYEGSQAILRVENMEASLRFYVGVLGFANASWGNEDFTSVNRDRAGIYLCRGGQGRGGAWVWLGVEDVEVVYRDLKARGVRIRMPPTNYSWALEMQIEDPDGNVLRLGSEPRPE